MKRLLVGILVLIMLFCFVGCSGAKGENITNITTTENMVYFDPECPRCRHIGFTQAINLCKGEDYNNMLFCNACGHLFEISVER